MAHQSQKDFCSMIKNTFPDHFKKKEVLEIGSLIINGTVRDLFEDCNYIGLDVIEGNGVDIVSIAHEYDPLHKFDTIISAETFEHDCFFRSTIYNIIRLLKSDGLFLFTAAGYNRPEHGTLNTTSSDAPGLNINKRMNPSHYSNITVEKLSNALFLESYFKFFGIQYSSSFNDIYFWGIKR